MNTLEAEIHELNASFLEYSLRHAEEIAEYFAPEGPGLAEARKWQVRWKGELLPVPPALVPARLIESIASCHWALCKSLDYLFDNRLHGSWQCLAEVLRLEEGTLRYIDTRRRPRWLTICRPDVILDGDDITLVEPNAGSSCGCMPEADLLGRAFESSPKIGDFLRGAGAHRKDAVSALSAHLSRCLRDSGAEQSDLIAVVEFAADLQESEAGYEVMAQELRRQGLRVEVAAVEELEVGSTGVFHHGERCAALYRFAADEPDPIGNYERLAPLLKASKDGRVLIVDELSDAIAANKTILAPLSEELDAGRLCPEVARILATFIPWTRVLEECFTQVDGQQVDLPQWSLSHQPELVLKPGAGFCGRGVVVGAEVDDVAWSKAVGTALLSSEAWIVQRLVVSHPTHCSIVRDSRLLSEESYVDYGYFAIAGHVPALIRKNAPFGTKTRRVKLAAVGPAYVV